MTGGRRTRRRGCAWLAMAVVGVLGLSACTHKDPPPQPSVTRTASVQPSPTVTPPVAPVEAPTPKSAEAFVRYFWDVHNYSYATLNTTLFRSLSDTECKFCESTIKNISELKTAGSVSDGSEVKVVVASAPPSKITTGIIVATVVSQEPGHILRSDGSSRAVPGMPNTQGYVGLNWTGQKWLVDDVALENSRKTP
jgi:Family of unknown function (DUF6318)